jgi:hypothetical protein
MICRNCGTEIADKAIVCFRCGTGTADPVRKPAEIRRKRSPVLLLVILVLLALAALIAGYGYHVFGFELIIPSDSAYSVYLVPVLIDFPAIHA